MPSSSSSGLSGGTDEVSLIAPVEVSFVDSVEVPSWGPASSLVNDDCVDDDADAVDADAVSSFLVF